MPFDAYTNMEIKVPCVTLCGHIFELSTIFIYVSEHDACPVCAKFITKDDIYYIKEMHHQLSKNILQKSVSTDTDSLVAPLDKNDMDVEDFDDLPTPFVALTEDGVLPPLSAKDYASIGNGRIVDLGVDTFNPQSSNPFLRAVVDRMNLRYMNTLLPRNVAHPFVVIRKYVYTHLSNVASEVARDLSFAGYYVYDLFKHRGNTWILYSCEVLVNGSNVKLPSLKN